MNKREYKRVIYRVGYNDFYSKENVDFYAKIKMFFFCYVVAVSLLFCGLNFLWCEIFDLEFIENKSILIVLLLVSLWPLYFFFRTDKRICLKTDF